MPPDYRALSRNTLCRYAYDIDAPRVAADGASACYFAAAAALQRAARVAFPRTSPAPRDKDGRLKEASSLRD